MTTFASWVDQVLRSDPIIPAFLISTSVVGLARSIKILIKDTKGLPLRERIEVSGYALFEWYLLFLTLYLLSLAFVYAVGFVTSYWASIIGLVNTPYAVMIAVIVACLLFKLRSRHAAIYGALELLVALVAIYYAAIKTGESVAVKTTAIFGGIYVFVRGLDNIGRELPPYLRRFWKWIT